MSLLHFWNKNKLERDDLEDASETPESPDATEVSAADGVRGRQAPAASESPVPPLADLGLPGGGSLNLDEIRAALEKISEIIRDDEEREHKEEAAAGNFTELDLTVGVVAGLIPHLFRDAAAAAKSTDRVQVLVEDLYEQLKTGKVSTTVRRVVAKVEEDILVPEFVEYQKDAVSIPLHLAVCSVRPDELKKRTSSEERDDGLDAMPNLFHRPSEPAPATPPVIETDDLLKPDRVPPKRREPVAAEPSATEPAKDEKTADADTQAGDVYQRPTLAGGADRLGADRSMDTGLGDRARFDDKTEPELETEPDPVVPDAGRGSRFDLADEGDLFKPEPTTDVEPAEPAEPVETAEQDTAPSSSRAPAMDEQEAHNLYQEEDTDEGAVPAESTGEAVTLRGVDINTASKKELMDRLDGVGIKLAERIERYRRLQGPFRSLTDLTRVSGVGPSTYERMTGQSWSEARDDTRRTLDYLLGSDDEPMPDLRAAAKRFSALPSCDGCIITHEDGHVLASEWDHPSQEMLGAVIPQFFKKTEPYMEQLELGELNPATLFFGDIGITMVRCGDTYLALIHRVGRLGKRQIQLVQLAGAELEARLDRVKTQK